MGYSACCWIVSHKRLSRDGLIIEKRGPRSDGTTPEPLDFLTTNEVLKKLRIALALRDDEVLAVFECAEFVVTKAELGSFFRKEG